MFFIKTTRTKQNKYRFYMYCMFYGVLLFQLFWLKSQNVLINKLAYFTFIRKEKSLGSFNKKSFSFQNSEPKIYKQIPSCLTCILFQTKKSVVLEGGPKIMDAG